MSIYRILSALLSYPEQDMIDALPEIKAALADWPEALDVMAPLFTLLEDNVLIAVQENYVATFDRNPAHSLHLFEHVHGESRDRGQAMVDLIEEYRSQGLEPAEAELPDHVPLFLEFLSLVPEHEANRLLGEAIHVMAAIGARLARNESPYATVFIVLRGMTDVVPLSQTDPPVRDMDEALETYGVGVDGVEPLLRPQRSDAQVVQFHPRAAAAF